jgi:hypothetical protein
MQLSCLWVISTNLASLIGLTVRLLSTPRAALTYTELTSISRRRENHLMSKSKYITQD